MNVATDRHGYYGTKWMYESAVKVESLSDYLGGRQNSVDWYPRVLTLAFPGTVLIPLLGWKEMRRYDPALKIISRIHCPICKYIALKRVTKDKVPVVDISVYNALNSNRGF